MSDFDLWNAISDGVSNATKHSDHGDVVDAILEQVEMELSKCEPLYRLTEHAVVLDAGRGEFVIDGIVSQVWPKDSDDD